MSTISYSAETADGPSASTSRDPIFQKLILEESISFERFVLIYQIVGRVLFTGIILALAFWQVGSGRQLPTMIFVILLAALWFLQTMIVFNRARGISRLIAETDYSADPKWGALFIKSHHLRYEDRLGRAFASLVLLEPMLWGAVSLWLLWVK